MDDRAVSDLMGSILMVAMTTMVIVGLGLVFFGSPPEPGPSAQLEVRHAADETRIRHLGGEPIPEDRVRVQATVDGSVETLDLTAFSTDYASGDPKAWDIGETICVSCRFPGQRVTEIVVLTSDRTLLSWTGNARVTPANRAPTASFTVEPSEPAPGDTVWFNSTSSDPDGSITVWDWELGDGTTDAGEQVTHTYAVKGTYTVNLTVTDDGGKQDGDAETIAVAVTDYVDCPMTANTGTVSGCSNARSASDGGAEATLAEEKTGTGSQTSTDVSADQVVSSGSFSDGANGFSSDDTYATATKTTGIRYGLEDPGASGTIDQVVLKAEVSITSWTDDAWRLQACLAGGSCSTESGELGGSATDEIISYDVTSLRPGGGSWTPSDMADLETKVIPVKNGGADGTWRIDHANATVTYTPDTYELEIVGDVSSVPAGTNELQLRYRVQDETFRVEVWNGSDWNLRGAVLEATAATDWSYTLKSVEYNGGAPRIRFIDRDPSGTTQGELLLDYARIRTT